MHWSVPLSARIESSGATKSIEILSPPLPMPEPFEGMVQASQASALGENATEVMASILEIVETVLDSKLPMSLKTKKLR